ncbi:hypothetical protein JSY36_08470 [Bacillus sp. H-16]|uniref:hypothetical protein n=1 Tax=Alteribacter salitolerans TaxID=2912333 RepID=UPI001962B39C|nr:hypothetical protein [Alteribacter salitolerans]MBM7095786.1 hypothetical protein [Alteribacter salitolerans]
MNIGKRALAAGLAVSIVSMCVLLVLGLGAYALAGLVGLVYPLVTLLRGENVHRVYGTLSLMFTGLIAIIFLTDIFYNHSGLVSAGGFVFLLGLFLALFGVCYKDREHEVTAEK